MIPIHDRDLVVQEDTVVGNDCGGIWDPEMGLLELGFKNKQNIFFIIKIFKKNILNGKHILIVQQWSFFFFLG